jgi:hypothetical protein
MAASSYLLSEDETILHREHSKLPKCRIMLKNLAFYQKAMEHNFASILPN